MNLIFRLYGTKKAEAPTGPGLPKCNQISVPKPIITVTEFTPGNTPDKVRYSLRIKNVFFQTIFFERLQYDNRLSLKKTVRLKVQQVLILLRKTDKKV